MISQSLNQYPSNIKWVREGICIVKTNRQSIIWKSAATWQRWQQLTMQQPISCHHSELKVCWGFLCRIGEDLRYSYRSFLALCPLLYLWLRKFIDELTTVPNGLTTFSNGLTTVNYGLWQPTPHLNRYWSECTCRNCGTPIYPERYHAFCRDGASWLHPVTCSEYTVNFYRMWRWAGLRCQSLWPLRCFCCNRTSCNGWNCRFRSLLGNLPGIWSCLSLNPLIELFLNDNAAIWCCSSEKPILRQSYASEQTHQSAR